MTHQLPFLASTNLLQDLYIQLETIFLPRYQPLSLQPASIHIRVCARGFLNPKPMRGAILFSE